MEKYITVGDCAIVLQGKNIDKTKLNKDKKGLPYIVGASCLKDSGIVCDKYCENYEEKAITQIGDVLISVVGTIGKFAVNTIGDCVLSKHVCAVRFVPAITPEYGLLCLMGSIGAVIPPVDENAAGFSRRITAEDIAKTPFLLIGINRQKETVAKMQRLTQCFSRTKYEEKSDDKLPSDPIALIKWYKRKSTRLLKSQFETLDEICAILQSCGTEDTRKLAEQLTVFDFTKEITA